MILRHKRQTVAVRINFECFGRWQRGLIRTDASHGRSTLNSAPFLMDFDGERSAFSTPNGDQLNLYRNGLEPLGYHRSRK